MKKQLKIYIDADLLKKFRVKCAIEEVNFSECLEKLIREWMKEKKDEIK